MKEREREREKQITVQSLLFYLFWMRIRDIVIYFIHRKLPRLIYCVRAICEWNESRNSSLRPHFQQFLAFANSNPFILNGHIKPIHCKKKHRKFRFYFARLSGMQRRMWRVLVTLLQTIDITYKYFTYVNEHLAPTIANTHTHTRINSFLFLSFFLSFMCSIEMEMNKFCWYYYSWHIKPRNVIFLVLPACHHIHTTHAISFVLSIWLAA